MHTANGNETKQRQPEEGGDNELNLTNNDASLQRGKRQQPDAPTMNDSAANVNNEKLNQSASEDHEVNPEFGDAADPAFETI